MKTLIATLMVSTFALTGAAFADKTVKTENNVEASSTNGNSSGLTSADIDSLFYDHPEN